MSDHAGDCEAEAIQRKLVDEIFRPEIEACLIPTDVLDHMPETNLGEVSQEITAVENGRGSHEAAKVFLEKLLECKTPGWFRSFIVALDVSGYSYLANLLSGRDVYQSRTVQSLFQLHKPELKKIIPLNITNTLQQLHCLREEDLSKITAVAETGGNFKGAIVLMDLVSRKNEDWFPKLMYALNEHGNSDIVQVILTEEAAQIETWEEMKGLIKKFEENEAIAIFKDDSHITLLDKTEREHRLEYSSVGTSDGEKLHLAAPRSVPSTRSRPTPEGTPALRLEDAHNPSPKTPTEPAEEHSLEVHGPLNSLANNLNQEEERKPFPTCKIVESENELGDNSSDTKPKMLDQKYVPNEGRPTEGSGAASDSHEFHLNIDEPEVEEQQLDLRGYQMELAQPALDGKNIIVSAPTGTGKTHVALKIVDEHFRKADPEQEPKVLFLVPTVELVRQQWEMFKTYLHNHKSVGLSGDLNLLEKVPVERLIHRYEIIILTPQILVDALKDQSVPSLSVFSLLLYDECHHTMKGHPYARVQRYYLTTKLQNPGQPTNLPQVVGFTASVGVGKKTRTLDGAVNHILKLCANLDVETLKTVEKNRRELDKYENKPNEERKEVKGRLRDPFHDEVSQMMNIIETKMKRAPELRRVSDQKTAQQLAAPPGERGGERYTEWLGKLKKPIARIRDQDARRFFHACSNHLEFYNCSLVVNADCRTVDALKVIEKKMKKLTPEQEDETDKWLSGMFRDHKDSLKQAGDDPKNSNPKLEVVKRMIYEGYQKNPENLRCIMFVKTREMTEALANWINEDGELKHLAASSLAGKGQSTEKAGMNQAQQKDVLQYFKDGMHKVIVATTVAEEGLDIQKCNLVIRYEHVTNEIAYVQARGRGRAEDAEYYLVGGAGTGTVEREEINMMREQLMEKAIKKIREMKEETFQRYINLYQLEILREWTRTEARKNRRVRSASDDEEDVYELRCIRSNHLACFSSDIRKVKDSHHIVTDVKILEEVNIEPHPRPGTYDAFTKLGKLFCKECGEDWGIQVLYKGIKLPVIKISAFVVVFPNGARDSFKKWSQSPFDNDLQTLTDEELNEYNDELKQLDLQ